MYQYVFDPLASKEYEDAFLWYEKQSTVAADNFIVAVHNSITLICSAPHRHRNLYRSFREVTLRRYPFNLIYYVDDVNQLVVIVSVYHHKRDPLRKYSKK